MKTQIRIPLSHLQCLGIEYLWNRHMNRPIACYIKLYIRLNCSSTLEGLQHNRTSAEQAVVRFVTVAFSSSPAGRVPIHGHSSL